ncbi:endonuclease/exonuclease/phosphatase family protein [Pelagovum pacificum]|uniref:Endonuclease/exonuclease/phosphatase family protein n=1 Tax=Pelagovum pacificum TaxID=2588711 RepID=A0A5C5GM88_9RHOB|nr:endonuclease/exonuclease/phosphatase family protein [Pelagovum pacificum]TNY34406.1 endonuclease/exonuclease/phosphatase family protein [Pelagovum pacificum]
MLWPFSASADSIRLAVFAAPLSRDGPGLLLRDILDQDPQAAGAARIVAEASPDILLLTDFDYDSGLAALSAFAEVAGGFEHGFALLPNAGMATDLDLDGDGRVDARDAQGYGRFAGDGGLAILSRWPIDRSRVQDFSALLWRDLPGATLPQVGEDPFPSEAAQTIQRLSSTGHWVVSIEVPGGLLHLLVHSATPPVFDGPEDRNGLRNRDELRLWTHFLDGALGPPPGDRFVIMANTNLDPENGDGRREAMQSMLSDPRLQDPRPRSAGGAALADPDHAGDPALDTADWDDDGAGNLRVVYIMPSRDMTVLNSEVRWSPPGTPEAAVEAVAGPHRLVLMDVEVSPDMTN